jgi:predicted Zn-dependent protease
MLKRVLLVVLAVIFFGLAGLYVLLWPGKSLYLVAVGPTPASTLDSLAAHVERKFSLEVTILSEVPLDESIMDPDRRQLVAEDLLALMKSAHRWQAWNPRSVLIGITPYDMYARQQREWRFVFNWRQRGSAVISMARLDPVNLGQPADALLFQQRLRKVVDRNIGFQVFLRPPSHDPRSILFTPVMGVDELDRMAEDDERPSRPHP